MFSSAGGTLTGNTLVRSRTRYQLSHPGSPRGSHNPGSSTGGIFSQRGGGIVSKEQPRHEKAIPMGHWYLTLQNKHFSLFQKFFWDTYWTWVFQHCYIQGGHYIQGRGAHYIQGDYIPGTVNSLYPGTGRSLYPGSRRSRCKHPSFISSRGGAASVCQSRPVARRSLETPAPPPPPPPPPRARHGVGWHVC